VPWAALTAIPNLGLRALQLGQVSTPMIKWEDGDGTLPAAQNTKSPWQFSRQFKLLDFKHLYYLLHHQCTRGPAAVCILLEHIATEVRVVLMRWCKLEKCCNKGGEGPAGLCLAASICSTGFDQVMRSPLVVIGLEQFRLHSKSHHGVLLCHGCVVIAP
jgi:hypothetical protein